MVLKRGKTTMELEPVPQDLVSRLSRELDEYTGAERAIANYIIANRDMVAFETAASLAEKLGVSAVTVGRFCRRLGYPNLRALKGDLKMDIAGIPWLVGNQLARFVERSKEHGEFRKSLELDVAGIVEVYTMAESPEWASIVELLSTARTVQIVGFQTERGIAALLGHMLQYVRPGVRLIDGAAGNYAEVLTEDAGEDCLVIIETRRYSKHAYMLCEYAQSAGIPTVVLTDKYNDWATRFTKHVVAVSTQSELFWNSEVPLACAANLLANSVVARLGAAVEDRLAKFSELYQTFTGHVGLGRRRNGG